MLAASSRRRCRVRVAERYSARGRRRAELPSHPSRGRRTRPRADTLMSRPFFRRQNLPGLVERLPLAIRQCDRQIEMTDRSFETARQMADRPAWPRHSLSVSRRCSDRLALRARCAARSRRIRCPCECKCRDRLARPVAVEPMPRDTSRSARSAHTERAARRCRGLRPNRVPASADHQSPAERLQPSPVASRCLRFARSIDRRETELTTMPANTFAHCRHAELLSVTEPNGQPFWGSENPCSPKCTQ